MLNLATTICSPPKSKYSYFANIAQSDPTAPRVAVIRHSFEHDYLMYAVIEPVETVPVMKDIFIRKMAEAVLWMRRQPRPDGVALGPLGSAPIRHTIFDRGRAPLPFTSVVALERFLNTVISKLRRLRQPNLPYVSISNERVVLTQSDMNPSNFGVDTTGKPVVFDFDGIRWLPESLANYTLFCRGFYETDVAALVFGDEIDSVRAASHLKSLGEVKVCLITGFQTTHGPDKDGNPVSESQSDANA